MNGITSTPASIFSHAMLLTLLLMTMGQTSARLSPLVQELSKDHSIVISSLF
jgi:hypothetical protein